MSINASDERLIPAVTPRRVPMPLPGAMVAVLAAAFCLIGIAGHAPWKTEDAVGVGVVHALLSHAGDLSHWLVPHLAGEIYLDDGPLFYILAAACAKLFSFVLPQHDGARIASALALGTTLWFCRETARRFFGPDEGNSAALLLIGCLGLFAHAHMLDGENGALAGAALAWYALSLAIKPKPASSTAAPAPWTPAPWRAGLLFGSGLAIVLLAKGAGLLVPLLASALLAPLAGAEWRGRAHWICVGTGLALCTVIGGLWLLGLHSVDADLPGRWWDIQLRVYAQPNFDRLREQAQLLSWALWPLWPVGLWALWERRHRFGADSGGCAFFGIGVLAAATLFVLGRDVNEILAMPIFLPLAALAGAGFTRLRRGAANALAWFGAMTFTLFGALVWLGWLAMMTGVPTKIAGNVTKLEPGFVAHFSAPPLLAALVLSLAWIALLAWSERSRLKGAAVWAAGVTLVWGLIMSLWLSWIDYGKSYAPMAAALKTALLDAASQTGTAGSPGADAGCVASRNLGQAQRAAFDYHADIVTERIETRAHAERDCKILLVQGLASRPDRLDSPWEKVWEGSRPRERERYRLYVRH